MVGTIKLLDVGDGDAIIVSLDKENQNLIIVIDGGKSGHYETKVKPELVKLLREKGKDAPDIVVATHYDSDHIGGLIPLIDDYITNIREIWVHCSPELNHKALTIYDSREELKHLKSREQFLFESNLMLTNSHIKEDAIMTKSSFIIESLKQLDTFLGKIPPHKIRQVYHGDSYEGWPEIKVLGPTKEYYDSLFPKDLSLEQLVIQETIDYRSEGIINSHRFMELATYLSDPCQSLKTESTAKLTPTNKASIIISIKKNDDKFLFTGDAGITSFKNIPDWKNELSNLYWLKIPHHGSDNNISTEIIDVMQPKYADNSGDRHQDNNVIACIERNAIRVRSTKNNGDLHMAI
ncbi:ComEC/Rec2 family competence protein [Flavobacterium anhuiense]|uniref:ComEC/Rec2 family competence protein n=1 Tax=Flavobacterium anhuiense TaxID=459526 RepID=UPI0011839A8F|nr:MBL fold metallo-hydrolase [Flavobacterium anhuiense]